MAAIPIVITSKTSKKYTCQQVDQGGHRHRDIIAVSVFLEIVYLSKVANCTFATSHSPPNPNPNPTQVTNCTIATAMTAPATRIGRLQGR